MNASLEQLYKSLEEQRNGLLQSVRTISHGQLTRYPKGKWSIAHILSHLVTSEQLSVSYLTKKIQGIDETGRTGILEELKLLTLIISQRLPLKFRAPKVVVDNTHVFQSLPEIEQAWQKIRDDLKSLLERFEEDHLNRKVYKHPVAGKMNIKQALIFIREHTTHHTPQIKKLLKQK